MIKHFFLAIPLAIALFACNNYEKQKLSSMNSQEVTQHQKDERNKAVALQCILAYQVHDSEFILAHNADTVINIYTGRPPIHGIDSCRIVLRDAFNTFKYTPSKEHALADSNYVFIFLYADAVMNKDQKTERTKMVEIFKFNDEGKIVLHTSVGEDLQPSDERISF